MPAVAKKKEKTVPMYLRFPARLKAAMESQADESRRGFSVELAIAAEEYLERLGKWPPPPEPEGQDKPRKNGGSR